MIMVVTLPSGVTTGKHPRQPAEPSVTSTPSALNLLSSRQLEKSSSKRTGKTPGNDDDDDKLRYQAMSKDSQYVQYTYVYCGTDIDRTGGCWSSSGS